MKLLKFIPAAAIALATFMFMPLEGKTEEICMYNGAGFVIDKMKIINSSGATKDTGSFTAGFTKCIKLGDVPVPLNTDYRVEYTIVAGGCDYQGSNTCSCTNHKDLLHSSSDEGKTYTYEVTGTTSVSTCKLK